MQAIRPLLASWLALIALLCLTVGASFLLTGPASLTAGMAIALAKAALIFWFFMNLRGESGLVRLLAAGAFLWLIVLLALIFSDYATRGGT